MSSKTTLKDRQKSFFDMILQETPKNIRESIYSNAYRIRFEESLREDFPVAISLDNDFPLRLDSFCKDFGSQSWSLNHLGQRWMDFLKQLEQTNFPGWLFDLYQLEALQFQSFFLNSESPRHIGPIDLGEGLMLHQTQPFLSMKSDWDLESIWQSEKAPDSMKKSFLLFYKLEQGNTFVTLDPTSAEIISHLFAYKSLDGIPAHLCKSEDISAAFAYLGSLFTAQEDS